MDTFALPSQDLDLNALFDEALRMQPKKKRTKTKPKRCKFCSELGHYQNTCEVLKVVALTASSSRRKTYTQVNGTEPAEFLRTKTFKTPSKTDLKVPEGANDEIFQRDKRGNITRIMFEHHGTYVFEPVLSLMYTDSEESVGPVGPVGPVVGPSAPVEVESEPEAEEPIGRAKPMPASFCVPRDSIFPTGIRR